MAKTRQDLGAILIMFRSIIGYVSYGQRPYIVLIQKRGCHATIVWFLSLLFMILCTLETHMNIYLDRLCHAFSHGIQPLCPHARFSCLHNKMVNIKKNRWISSLHTAWMSFPTNQRQFPEHVKPCTQCPKPATVADRKEVTAYCVHVHEYVSC